MRHCVCTKVFSFALLLAMLFAGLQFTAAVAQDRVIMENVQVDIWPEYDQPSLLVIYHINLSPQTTLPAEIQIRIPANVDRPYAVAMQDPAGLYNLDYEIQAAGEWIVISFTTPVPDFRIEYYDPQLDLSSSERSFIFRWPGDYQVENLSLQVQQPPTASNMVFKPTLGSGRVGDDGLTYFYYLIGSIDAGTTFDLSVSYSKADDQLTSASQFQAVQPQEPVNASTNSQITLDQVLPWALGGLSLVLILAGGIWYWRTGRASQPASPRFRHARKPSPPDEPGGGSIFCHQCGKKAAKGDLFCRSCGTKLK